MNNDLFLDNNNDSCFAPVEAKEYVNYHEPHREGLVSYLRSQLRCGQYYQGYNDDRYYSIKDDDEIVCKPLRLCRHHSVAGASSQPENF